MLIAFDDLKTDPALVDPKATVAASGLTNVKKAYVPTSAAVAPATAVKTWAVVTVATLVALVALVTAVAPIAATISAALALLTAAVTAPLSNAPDVNVIAPVPPLATGSVPVTPVVSGNPVKFVATPDVGVPSTGVIIVGLVNVPVLTVGFVSVPVFMVGLVNVPVLTAGFVIVGVTMVGLVNSKVFVNFFVIPPCTIGIMSEAAAADAAGKPEIATVAICNPFLAEPAIHDKPSIFGFANHQGIRIT